MEQRYPTILIKDNIQVSNSNIARIKESPIPKARAISGSSIYDFTYDPDDAFITLYRGTTGSESRPGFLYMTDDPSYASYYIKNGGQLVKATIPKHTFYQMQFNGDVSIKNGLLNIGNDISTSYIGGLEYEFTPSVKSQIVSLFTPF